jgi:hypothetical protein
MEDEMKKKNVTDPCEITEKEFAAAYPVLYESIREGARHEGVSDVYNHQVRKHAETVMQGNEKKSPTPEQQIEALRAELANLPLEQKAERTWNIDAALRAEYCHSGFKGFLATIKHDVKARQDLERRYQC